MGPPPRNTTPIGQYSLAKQGKLRTSPSSIWRQKIPNLKAFPRRFLLGSTNGEIMGTAASLFLNPIAAELDGAGTKPTAKVLLRRAQQRRQIQGMIGASYVIDAAVLLLYGYAGTTPLMIGPAF